MTKYIITSGKSVVSTFKECPDGTSVEISTKNPPLASEKIGEAINLAQKINSILNTNSFRVMSVDNL